MNKPQQKYKRLGVYLITVFIVIGIFLRLSYYLKNRSFWLDEAFLALNIVNKSFVDLFTPLDYNQGAPIGFLFAQKVIVTILGNSDLILRIIPLISGIVAIPLMFVLSKGYNQTMIAQVISIGLLSFSDRLIYYSSEMKQYSSDVLVTLVMLLTADWFIEKKDNLHCSVLFGLIGALAIWLSHPSLFVIIGIIFALGILLIKQNTQIKLSNLAGLFFIWALSFGINYIVSLRSLVTNNKLTNYWQNFFMPHPSWESFSWFNSKLFELLNDPASLPVSFITIVLLLLGCFSFFQRQLKHGVFVVTPIIAALIASAFGKYPFGGRLMLFSVPLLYLLVTQGIERIYLWLKQLNPSGGLILSVSLGIYLIFPQIQTAYENFLSPPMGEHIKPVMAYLSENHQDTDIIYLYYSAGPAFEYYSSFYGFDQNEYIKGIASRPNPDLYLTDIDHFKKYNRVWFVFTHNCSWCKVDEQNYILAYLDEIGIKKDQFISTGASLYLYDLRNLQP